MSDFNGKVALVTGASSGIGASEVRLLAAKGARVLATDILRSSNSIPTGSGNGRWSDVLQ